MATPKHERLKAADVCQLAQVQPYVLRTWEAEFPDLGQATASGSRVYGKKDVDRVLQIRELVYGEGLTLAGARKRLEEEAEDAAEVEASEPDPVAGSFADDTVRVRLRSIRDGLAGVLALLERPLEGDRFTLVPTTAAPARRAPAKATRRGAR